MLIWSIPVVATVTAKIYDLTGKQIRMIELGHVTAGSYIESSKAIYWDEKTDSGETVASWGGRLYKNQKNGDSEVDLETLASSFTYTYR